MTPVRITTLTSTVVTDKDAYVYAVFIAVAVATGGNNTLKIQNGETPPDGPKILVPAYTLYVEPDTGPTVPFRPPNPRNLEWTDYPKLMRGGIVIVTAGTATPIEVAVWIDYVTQEGAGT